MAMEVAEIVYQTTQHFPTEEKFNLCSQLRRASISIPSNIAEGCSRQTGKEKSRFIEIAIGSAFELETQILLSKRFSLIPEDIANELLTKVSSLQISLGAYRKAINGNKRIQPAAILVIIALGISSICLLKTKNQHLTTSHHRIITPFLPNKGIIVK